MARRLHTLKDTGVFSAWSYKSIVNHAITMSRRRSRTQIVGELPIAVIAIKAMRWISTTRLPLFPTSSAVQLFCVTMQV